MGLNARKDQFICQRKIINELSNQYSNQWFVLLFLSLYFFVFLSLIAFEIINNGAWQFIDIAPSYTHQQINYDLNVNDISTSRSRIPISIRQKSAEKQSPITPQSSQSSQGFGCTSTG